MGAFDNVAATAIGQGFNQQITDERMRLNEQKEIQDNAAMFGGFASKVGQGILTADAIGKMGNYAVDPQSFMLLSQAASVAPNNTNVIKAHDLAQQIMDLRGKIAESPANRATYGAKLRQMTAKLKRMHPGKDMLSNIIQGGAAEARARHEAEEKARERQHDLTKEGIRAQTDLTTAGVGAEAKVQVAWINAMAKMNVAQLKNKLDKEKQKLLDQDATAKELREFNKYAYKTMLSVAEKKVDGLRKAKEAALEFNNMDLVNLSELDYKENILSLMSTMVRSKDGMIDTDAVANVMSMMDKDPVSKKEAKNIINKVIVPELSETITALKRQYEKAENRKSPTGMAHTSQQALELLPLILNTVREESLKNSISQVGVAKFARQAGVPIGNKPGQIPMNIYQNIIEAGIQKNIRDIDLTSELSQLRDLFQGPLEHFSDIDLSDAYSSDPEEFNKNLKDAIQKSIENPESAFNVAYAGLFPDMSKYVKTWRGGGKPMASLATAEEGFAPGSKEYNLLLRRYLMMPIGSKWGLTQAQRENPTGPETVARIKELYYKEWTDRKNAMKK